MNLQETYKNYTDKYGLVQPQPNTVSENGVRFSGEAFLAHWEAAKWQQTQYADESQVKFCLGLAQAIGSCADRISVDLPAGQKGRQVKMTGIMRRWPEYPLAGVQEGPDDYIAALAVSYLVGSNLAKRIYVYGLKHCGFYCNAGFAWNAALWRNPSLCAFTKFCATDKLGIIGQAIIAISFISAAKTTNQDSKVLSWFMVRCLKSRYWLVDRAIAYWTKKLKAQYIHGIGDVLGQYYDPAHYSHPNSVALMDVFE